MQNRNTRITGIAIATLLATAVGVPRAGAQTTPDLCGCAGANAPLGDFISSQSATFPPGTSVTTGSTPDEIFIPLPDDGVLLFHSMTIDNSPSGDNAVVRFVRNAKNTPATVLVQTDVTLGENDGFNVNGFAGGNAGTGLGGAGATPGPGGFSGGKGLNASATDAVEAGSGLGPGGGRGGIKSPVTNPVGGSFLGVPELRPLRGGSGGGGGFSNGASTNCSGGGGGGGGGALLLAVNGTFAFTGGASFVNANGGDGGANKNGGACDSQGAGGSGGAIRLVANRITGNGTLRALGGSSAVSPGGSGSIRIEALVDSFGSNTSPVAFRSPLPGALENPTDPTVQITAIDGASTPEFPQGFLGIVEMTVAAPGAVQIDLATQDVPVGTDVEVTVKPVLGQPLAPQRTTLASCVAGACTANTSFDLAAGAYIVEARATFQTP